MAAWHSGFVYVATDGVRMKVGQTIDLKLRPYQLSREHGKLVTFVHVEGPVLNAEGIENTAHWLLADHQDDSEWFNITAEVAIAAVREAMAKVSSGDYPTQKAVRGARQLPIRLDEALERALRPGEKRRDFLRIAVQRELEHRRAQEAMADAA